MTVQKIFVSLLLLASVFFFTLQLISNRNGNGPPFDRVSIFLIKLLLFWGIITILRGFHDADANQLFTLLANPYIGGLVWLMPFAVYIGRQPGLIDALMPVFRLHTLIGLVLVFWTMIDVVYLGTVPEQNKSRIGFSLLYAAPFVLVSGLGQRLERKLYFLCLCLALAVLYLLFIHRTEMVSTLGAILLTVVLGQVKDFNKSWLRIILFSILFFIFLFFGLETILSQLRSEWFIDTRTFLWVELKNDFDLVDWVIGRGALGTYYSPYFNLAALLGQPGDWMVRQVNEIGYLHMVLKTGIIGAALYFLVYSCATFKALFRINSRFELGVGLLLSMHLIELVVGGQSSFSLSRLLLWLLVGTILQQKNRSQPIGSMKISVL